MAIRTRGKRVLYQPLSQVTCQSHGDFPARGIEEKGDRALLLEKWGEVLVHHGRSGDRGVRALDRTIKHRALIIDVLTPTPDQDSGSVDVFSLMKILRDMSFSVTFIPASNVMFMPKYTPDLQRMGVECLYVPYVTDIGRYLAEKGREFDVVLLYRVNCAAAYIDMARKYCPNAKIIFDTVDLHYLREERQAEIEGSEELKRQAHKTKATELSVIQRADCTIILSRAEYDILSCEPSIAGKELAIIPLIREIPGIKAPFGAREGIVFVGGYDHQPNVDAMLYFVKTIWPMVRRRLPGVKFYIVGSKAPKTILDLACEDVIVVGFVEDLATYFDACRLSVAPLRYGAGLKGKVGASMAYGLPCVATPLAVEGAGFQEGEHVLVADTPEAFVTEIARLYTDETLWNCLSANGLDFVKAQYSLDAGKERLTALLHGLGIRTDH
jgi:glycosyltransferase involved in cell wall biosynthesis